MLLLLVMTIAQLLAAAAENLSKAPAAMTESTHQNHLVRSVNGGLASFVAMLPDKRRAELMTSRLGPAQSRTAAVTQGSAALTFSPSWAAGDQASFLGRTLVVAGAEGYNRLASASTLLLPWEGATNAGASISIRSDAVVLGGLEDCVDGDVILALSDRNVPLKHGLPPDEDSGSVMRLLEGVPQHWWIEPLNGITGGAAPLYVLRVFPQPESVCSLVYRRKLWPASITWAMVASTAEIPVLPHEEVHLVNLCQEALFSHPLWLGSADKDQVREAVNRARFWLDGQTPNRGHTQPAMCRTRKGF